MDFDSFQEKASLMTLPIETRFMIYDLTLNCTGSLVIFSEYELARNIDKDTLHLLHVNRMIRAEVHEYFYKNQKFQFRSFQAMEKFLDKIGPYYTSIIKNVVLGSWLAQRAMFAEQITPFLEKLTGIDRLSILAPAHGFVTDWSQQAEMGDKAIAVLRASERLAAGKFYLAWTYGTMAAMQFVARNLPHDPQNDLSLRELSPADRFWRGHWCGNSVVRCIEVVKPENLLGSTSSSSSADEPIVIEDDSDSTNHSSDEDHSDFGDENEPEFNNEDNQDFDDEEDPYL